MSNTQEKQVSRLAQSKGYRLEKVGKGPHHGRFCLVSVAQDSAGCLRHPRCWVFFFAAGSGGLVGEGQFVAVYSRTLSVQPLRVGTTMSPNAPKFRLR